jgi:hypothetical protein
VIWRRWSRVVRFANERSLLAETKMGALLSFVAAPLALVASRLVGMRSR